MEASLPQRIDFLKLAINLGGNKSTIAHMLELFIQTTTYSLEKMEKAGHDNNVILWLQTAHQIKGAAKNITARRLALLCEEAETIRSLPHQQSANVLYNMHKELALLREEIEEYLGDSKPATPQ